MTPVPFYQVDAFADHLFAGNPAAVMMLDAFLPDEVLLAIAAENNLSETAFLVQNGESNHLRWFTPKAEVPLCGHATLATAAVVFERLGYDAPALAFETKSGTLTVTRDGDQYTLDFPALPTKPLPTTKDVGAAVGTMPLEVHANEEKVLVRIANWQDLRDMRPNLHAVAQLGRQGLIVTAQGGENADFESRFFAPRLGIAEDPVTGSAHTALAPFWAQRLKKTELVGYQCSARGGTVHCRLAEDRVLLSGTARIFIEGTANVPSA